VEDLLVRSLSRTGVIRKEESTSMEFLVLERKGKEQRAGVGRRRRSLEEEEGRDEEVAAPTPLEARAIRFRASGTRITQPEQPSSKERIIPTTVSSE